MNQYRLSSMQKHKFVQLSLYSKHNITITRYNQYQFTNLLLNKSHQLSLQSKEQGIDDHFEDYLKRFYYISESHIRIPQMAAYYKNYLIIFGVPTFCNLVLNSQIHSFATKKAEIYYNNHCNKDDNKISSLESNSNINKRNNAELKPGTILTKTMIQSIENKADQSSVSLVFNELEEITSDKYKKLSPISKEESLLTLLLMIDPVTDVLKDKMKKMSNTLTIKDITNNRVSTEDKTKTAKEDANNENNNIGDKGVLSNKVSAKKSRNKNLHSCGLLNTINTNNEILMPSKAKQTLKFTSMANNLIEFKTFFQQINSSKIKQLIKQIKLNKNLNHNIPSRRMPNNSPSKSRSNSKTNQQLNCLTRTYKNSDFIHFTYQPSNVAMNEYNTLKPRNTNHDINQPYSINKPNHKSYFSLTTKNMPLYITNANVNVNSNIIHNQRQSTQENVKSSLTISDSEKAKKKTKSNKPMYNKNIETKSSNYYLRKTKMKTKENQLRSYSQIKDSAANISRPINIKESTCQNHILNTYFNANCKHVNKIKLSHSKDHKPICYLMTRQDNQERSKPTMKIQITKQTHTNTQESDKKKKTQSIISKTKKKNKSITLDKIKVYSIGKVMYKAYPNNK